MRRTPLYESHVALNARLVDFAGWDMPLQYSGVVDEYQAVRRAAGLFDVSHMGRIRVSGSDAAVFLDHMTTTEIEKQEVLTGGYSMVCNPHGGIKDDIFVYRLQREEFLLCVNASNRAKIDAWLRKHAADHMALDLRDVSEAMAQIALQGPASRDIFNAAGLRDVDALKPRACAQTNLFGIPFLIARTGYTGEVGFECYIDAEQALPFWTHLLQTGKAFGLKPSGLGSRDLLRLEMAYLLYGNDISEDTTPLEAGAEWVVRFSKESFIGRAVLDEQRRQGVQRKLVPFELRERGVPRHGLVVYDTRQHVIGEVTSGNFSPLLQKGIGLAYVQGTTASVGTPLVIDIRGKSVPAVVVKPPFYRRVVAASH